MHEVFLTSVKGMSEYSELILLHIILILHICKSVREGGHRKLT